MTSDILQQYKILVEFLGRSLGPDYEIVLQDLTSENNEIIAIANSHISGRSTGSPLTNAALQMLSSRTYEKEDFLCNYSGIAENGHILRSSTMFIKDEDGTPIGLLCINFDDSRYLELSKTLRSIIHPAEFTETAALLETAGTSAPLPDSHRNHTIPVTENFAMNISSLMQKIFDESTSDLQTPVDHLNQHERKQIITRLHEQGMFRMKGAISFVARKFNCSTATVYRYLSEITS